MKPGWPLALAGVAGALLALLAGSLLDRGGPADAALDAVHASVRRVEARMDSAETAHEQTRDSLASVVEAAQEARDSAEARETRSLARLARLRADTERLRDSTEAALAVGGGIGDFNPRAFFALQDERQNLRAQVEAGDSVEAALRGQIDALASANEALRSQVSAADSLDAWRVRLLDAQRRENDALAAAVRRIERRKTTWQIIGGGAVVGAFFLGRGTK